MLIIRVLQLENYNPGVVALFNQILQSPYTISIPMQVRIVMLRRIQIIRGNYTPQVIFTM